MFEKNGAQLPKLIATVYKQIEKEMSSHRFLLLSQQPSDYSSQVNLNKLRF